MVIVSAVKTPIRPGNKSIPSHVFVAENEIDDQDTPVEAFESEELLELYDQAAFVLVNATVSNKDKNLRWIATFCQEHVSKTNMVRQSQRTQDVFLFHL